MQGLALTTDHAEFVRVGGDFKGADGTPADSVGWPLWERHYSTIGTGGN